MNEILFYLGGAFCFIWGVSHLFPTKKVVIEFGDITADNKQIIAMEWIIEGATLIFIGALTMTITYIDSLTVISRLVYGFVIVMLLVLAIISLFTGFKVNFLPYKLCPFIFTISAVLIYLGLIL